MAFADMAHDRKLFAAAARLRAHALEANPKLGDDLQAAHRYSAPCSAALAGSGEGTDNPPPHEAGRAKLRLQALDWLKADVDLRRRQVQKQAQGTPR